MKIKKLASPLVLIKVDKPRTMDDDGLAIAEEWKTLPPTGTVIEIGTAISICKPGDKVFFERYSSLPTPFGDNLRVVRSSGILAVYTDEE